MILRCYSCQRKNLSIFITRHKSFTSIGYCVDLTRNLDNESYFCTLLLPNNIRSATFALRAFNIEVASVQEQITQSRLGLMRLKFWEECIDKIFAGKTPNNPVAVELSKAVHRHKLSKTLLKGLVTSRANRLDETSFANTSAMVAYADATCGTLHRLIQQASGNSSQEMREGLIHLGKAQGLSNLLRGIPHCMHLRSVALPSDLLAREAISEESIIRGSSSDKIRGIVEIVASEAESHLDEAIAISYKVPSSERVLFLPLVPVRRYLMLLRHARYDVFDGGIQKKNPFLPFTLFFHKMIRRL